MPKKHENMTDEELKALLRDVSGEVKRRREERLLEVKKTNAMKLKELAKHKDVILSLLEHDRTSCSDDDPQNGLEIDGPPRCAKCGLMDLLEDAEWIDECDWEVHFSVSIRKSS